MPPEEKSASSEPQQIDAPAPEAIAQVVAPVPDDHPVKRTKHKGGFKKFALVSWYGLTGFFFSSGWFTRFVFACWSFGLVIAPAIKAGYHYSIPYSIIWISLGIARAWRDLSPKHMPVLQTNQNRRNLLQFKAVDKMRRLHRNKPSPEDVLEYQRDVLDLIVCYVRDHRRDVKNSEIFANLVVEQGEHMKVLARDQFNARAPGQPQLKKKTLAYLALRSGEPQVCGDIYADWPETPEGKPYKSVLIIPVTIGTDTVAVVSIDSSRRYRFDSEFRDLVQSLLPHVAMLAWTLEDKHTKGGA